MFWVAKGRVYPTHCATARVGYIIATVPNIAADCLPAPGVYKEAFESRGGTGADEN